MAKNFTVTEEIEDPQDEATPTLFTVIENLIEAKLYETRTMMPAKVLDYDHNGPSCTLQPVFKRRYADGELIEMAAIYKVPVAFWQAGESFISMPYEKGDYVVIGCSDRSLEKWLTSGDIVDPEDVRRHKISDAMILTGISPFGTLKINNKRDIIIKNKKGSGFTEIRLKPNGHVQILNSKGYDVINLIDEFMTAVQQGLTATGDAGPQPLVNADFSVIQQKFRTFKE